MRDHLVIFDTQIKPDSDIRHIDSIGKYIVRHQPEVIIIIGDWFDMHSLSSYDRGTKNAEGARYTEDIKCGVKALQNLFKHIKAWKKADPKGEDKTNSGFGWHSKTDMNMHSIA